MKHYEILKINPKALKIEFDGIYGTGGERLSKCEKDLTKEQLNTIDTIKELIYEETISSIKYESNGYVAAFTYDEYLKIRIEKHLDRLYSNRSVYRSSVTVGDEILILIMFAPAVCFARIKGTISKPETIPHLE